MNCGRHSAAIEDAICKIVENGGFRHSIGYHRFQRVGHFTDLERFRSVARIEILRTDPEFGRYRQLREGGEIKPDVRSKLLRARGAGREPAGAMAQITVSAEIIGSVRRRYERRTLTRYRGGLAICHRDGEQKK